MLVAHARSQMETKMEIRSTRTTLTFRSAFMLPHDVRTVPAGDYVLVTEEERLQGLTFTAYRRISGYLIVSGGPADPGRTEMIPISEIELAALAAEDATVVPGSRVITLPGPH
jgi:hypothetical protein